VKIEEENKRPYLSIVVASRNDNHGGDLLKRMQIFVTGLLEQCSCHKLDAELIIVEWNPPPDSPRLAEVLKWPDEPGPCYVRIIEVSPEIHEKFKYSDKLLLFQMIAKNVGIRRARGQFILATNIDLLFSDELMRFLASQKMAYGNMYRIDRYDVSSDVPTDVPITEMLNYCRKNIVRVNTSNGTISLKDVKGASRNSIWLQDKINRVKPWLPTLNQLKRLYSPYILLRGISHIVRAIACFFKWSLIPIWKCIALCGTVFLTKKEVDENLWKKLHTNACGDFTLMAKEHWFALRSYPEWEMYSFHIDSVFCYMASYASVREAVLPVSMRIYHVEHTAGWNPQQSKQLYDRLQSMGVPIMTGGDLLYHVDRLWKHGGIVHFNDNKWGLAGIDLKETSVYQE